MPTLAHLAGAVATLLRARGETVAIAESSTGGLIAASLLATPGASAFFVGGGVIYTGKGRSALLGIDLDDHPGLRPSTEPYARLMAITIRDLLGTTWAIGETGASGPTGNRYGDPAGHSCIAIAGPNAGSATIETGETDREGNMWRFTSEALRRFEDALRNA